MTLDAKTNMKNIAASADTNEKTDPAIPFSNKYYLKKLLLAPKKNWDLSFVYMTSLMEAFQICKPLLGFYPCLIAHCAALNFQVSG